MNQLIRAIGSFVVTCLIFACPVCLTLIFAFGKAKDMPPINRNLSSREYSIVKQKILAMGFENCNFQSGEAATESFIPNFNLEGVDL